MDNYEKIIRDNLDHLYKNLPDEKLPASATCLFSNNALSFLPIDALADTGEYTSKKIIELIS
jgi:hypothetical protein